MASKRQFKRRKLPPVRSFIYIDIGTSMQYLDPDVPEFRELAEIPDNVAEFWWESKILPASFAMNSSASMTTAMIEAQLSDDADTQRSAAMSQRLAMDELLASLSKWNLVDENDKAVAITLDNLAALEPGWLFGKIRQRHDNFNTGKNSRRG